MTQKLLECFFTGVYFAAFYFLTDLCFRRVPVNFVWDILAVVILIIGLVVSVALAGWTVQKIKETL